MELWKLAIAIYHTITKIISTINKTTLHKITSRKTFHSRYNDVMTSI